MTDVTRNGQDHVLSMELDVGALCLHPQPGLVAVDQLHFDTPRGGLPGEMLGDRLAKQGPVCGLDQVGDVTPGQLRRLQPDQAGGRFVGQQYALVMDDDDLGQRAGKIREQPITLLDLLVPIPQRVEQAIHRSCQRRRVGIFRDRQPPSHRGIDRCSQQFLVQALHPPHQPAARPPQKRARRDRQKRRSYKQDVDE